MLSRTATHLLRVRAQCLLSVWWQLVACFLLCNAPRALAQEYVFRTYRQTSGLENLAVNSIAADLQGFLWVGTENGVYRFLGSNFQRFGAAQGIREPYIMQVFAAPDGALWVASAEDLYRWRGQTFEHAVARPVTMTHAQSLASDGPGSLLVIVRWGLYRLRYSPDGISPDSEHLEPVFSAEQIAAHPSLGHLSAVAASPDGKIWLACGKMLCSWKPDAAQRSGPDSRPDLQSGVGAVGRGGEIVEWGGPQGVAPEPYRSIFPDCRGELWAISQENIVALPAVSGQSRRAFVDRSLPKSAGTDGYSRLPITCDRSGRAVVSMPGDGGIARWDGAAWQTVGKANGFVSTHLTALLFDERGTLWMGSGGHGLYRWIGYDEWQGWLDSQGLPSLNIWSIGPFNGSQVWVGTEKGPAIVDGRSGRVVRPPFAKDWPYGEVAGIAAAPDKRVASKGAAADGGTGPTLLIATVSGKVVRVAGDLARADLVADLQQATHQFLRDHSGRTFLFTDSGVFDVSALFDKRLHPTAQSASAQTQTPETRTPQTQTPQTQTPQAQTRLPQIAALLGPDAAVSQGCTSPDGSVWFVGENGLVRRAREGDRDVWSRPSLQGFPNPLPKLTDVECAADGTLWINANPDPFIWRAVYDPGANSATGDSSRTGRLTATPLAFPHALQTATIVDMFADPRGLLWVGTDDGVLVWNGSVWHHLTQEDGLIWNDINAAKMARGADGSIWVATSGGLSRILHPEHLLASLPLRTAIVGARIGERVLPLSGSAELAWSRRDISFEFAAPDAINRAGLRFHYRLDGLQSDWVESRDQTARFATLQPGNYSFEVFALDSVSGARSAAVSFGFRVMPPWWRTWWFYGLCGIAFGLAIAAVFRLRTRNLFAQQRRLESMVLERTSQLEASREELRRQATYDGLTGLLNRVAVLEVFDQELDRARRDGTSVTVVLADIDHFKHINDTHGHLAGDEALRRFSAALAGAIRSYDHVGRYGGEEFLLVLAGIDSDASETGGIRERLAALHTSISGLKVVYNGAEFVVNCSLGVVQVEDLQGGSDQQLALAAADEALYEAKRTGRNRFIFGHLDAKLPVGGSR